MPNFQRKVTLENGEVITVAVRRPTNDQLKEADIQRAKAWNKAFKEGVMTKNEVEKIMIERGTWSAEKTRQEVSLTKEILELEKKLYLGDGKSKPKLSEGRRIAIDMKSKRIALRDLIAERISMDENTAESLADNARFDYLVYACSFNADTGERLFDSYEDYNSKGATVEAVAAAQLLAQMVYNLDEEFEDKLPENKFLKQFNLIDDDGLLINPKTHELIDQDGRKINKEGHYLDSEGHRVDIDGNRLSDDGFYEMVDYENDLLDLEEPKQPKKTAKKNLKETETTTNG